MRILTFSLLWAFSRAAEQKSTSHLQVITPASLKKGAAGYEHKDALFGVPPYGGSIVEKLYWADAELCDDAVDRSTGYPKTDHGWEHPFILMVDRGGCHFVKKVRNAQRAGAAAVLIADSRCQCGAVGCVMKDGEKCEQEEPLMSDDGSGKDVSIASFLIWKQDADEIKEVLKGGTKVSVEMKFSVPSPDARVEYDLWMNAGHNTTKDLLEHFSKAAVALGDHAMFTPHMSFLNGSDIGCDEERDLFYAVGADTADHSCEEMCTNAGRYCASDPDGDGDEETGLGGADVIRETLRRICIWKQYGLKDGIGRKWWDYVDQFARNCYHEDNPKLFNDEHCIQSAMKKAKIKISAIETCVESSGGLDVDAPNKLLDEALRKKKEHGTVLLPTMLVNTVPVYGELEFETIFRAICAGYVKGSAPEICSCSSCHNIETCVKDNECPGEHAGSDTLQGISVSTFLMSMTTMAMVFVMLGWVVFRRQRRQMRDDVKNLMKQYMPVNNKRRYEAEVDSALSDDEIGLS